jgi:predicted transglutaminase-like cysteine proteinase
MSAGSMDRSATRHGVGFWKVATWAGLLLAGALSMFDPLDLISYPAAPMSLVAAEYVGSAPSTEAQAPTTPRGAVPSKEEDAGRLFGMDTEPVTAGALFDKWSRAKASIGQDLDVVSRCQTNEPCPPSAQKLIGLSREGAGRSARARLGLINRAVDQAISPMSDEKQWGVADHWSDPLETLQSSRGDCEDYAIVKYAALLKAGLPAKDVKIVVLKTAFPREDHAVVAVRADDQWLILDNRTLTLVRDTDMIRAIPEFILDQRGVRRFVLAGRFLRAGS